MSSGSPTTLSFKQKLQSLWRGQRATTGHLPVLSQTFPSLPREVIDVIIDYVASSPLTSPNSSSIQAQFNTGGTSTSRTQDLKNLSLASSLFLDSCRFHLFRKLRVQTGRRGRGEFHSTSQGSDANTYLLRTLHLFQKNTSLATYIKEVEIEFNFGRVAPLSYRGWGAAWFGEADVEALRQGQALLSRLLPMLQRLERIALAHVPRGPPVDWSNGMNQELSSALFGMIAMRSEESLKSLTLVGFRGLPAEEVLAPLQALERLEIPSSTSLDIPDRRLEMAWKLKSLTVASGSGGLYPLNHIGPYNTLTQLSLLIGTVNDHSVAWNIINTASQTLIAVKLDYSPRADEPNLVRDCLSEIQTSNSRTCMPNLRFLSINVLGQGESERLGFPASVPPTIPALISTMLDLLDLPSLEAFSAGMHYQFSFNSYLLLALNFATTPAAERRGVFGDGEAWWNRLVHILSSQLPRLRAIRIAVDPEIRDSPEPVEFDDEIYEVQDIVTEMAAKETESVLEKVGMVVEPELLLDAGREMRGSRFSKMVEGYWA